MMQCDPLETCQDNIIPWHTEKHVEQGIILSDTVPSPWHSEGHAAWLALLSSQIKAMENQLPQKLGSHQDSR